VKPCERIILHRMGRGPAEAVPWCNTHQEEMLTGLRCATGWDEEIAELRTEIAEIKLTLNRRMVR
jgi:hypothetical protein